MDDDTLSSVILQYAQIHHVLESLIHYWNNFVNQSHGVYSTTEINQSLQSLDNIFDLIEEYQSHKILCQVIEDKQRRLGYYPMSR